MAMKENQRGPPPQPHPRPVLVVEDDADIRETFRDVLESEGYEVYTAHEGREGLRVLIHLDQVESNGCVVLLDLMMPVMDGWEFLRQLGLQHLRGRVPVVVISAVAKNPTEGAAKVMEKPVDIDDLLKAVRKYELA